ncbi:MAG: SBBP repeat-containing protein, partial [Aggregatilineales bacterium]
AGSALVYSTYLGGSDLDQANGIAVDINGNAYVTGETASTDFPTSNAVQGTAGGNTDAFVTKLNAAGSALSYSTYLGGGQFDDGTAIVVDSNGNAYITGYTQSTNFPITGGASQATFSGPQAAFVTKMASAGTLVYSTFLGGNTPSSFDYGNGIGVDSSGDAYVTGRTAGGFPTTVGAYQTTFGGGFDAFVSKFKPDGSALLYSTYLGGNGADTATGLALDSSGNVYVTGRTSSSGTFPTTGGVFQGGYAGGPYDAFVSEFSLSVPPRIDTIGIYRSGSFFLRLHNSTGFADIAATFNPTNPAATQPFPVIGDWFGVGYDTIGILDQSNGLFSVCNANNTASCASSGNISRFVLGNPNDEPLSGRWSLTATHYGAGVFRPSNGLIYLKNGLTTGFADFTMVLGIPGDVGLAGDWNGKGFESPGVYRASNISFYGSNQVCNCAVFGDYQLQYGVPGDAPVVGDWIGQGHDGIGLFRQTTGFTYLRNALTTGYADISFVYGQGGDVPVAGHWQAVYPP